MTFGYLSYSACRADQERKWLSDVGCDGAFEMFDGEVLDTDNFTGLLPNAGRDFRSPRDRDDLGNTDWGVVGGRRVRSPEVGDDVLTVTSDLKVNAFPSTQMRPRRP